MSAFRRGRIPHDPRFKTANEAWKAGWGDRLAWSTVLGVAAHAAAFAFSPSWDPLDLRLEQDLEILETGTAWISLQAAQSNGGVGGGGAGVVMASLTPLEEPDSLPAVVHAGTGIGGFDPAAPAFSGGLRERLLGRGAPLPTIVEPALSLDRLAVEDDRLPLENDPLAVGDDPPALGDDRLALEDDRLALEDDPLALEDDPLALEDDPVPEEDDPVAEEDDPLTEEDDPAPTGEEEGFPLILVNPTIADPALRLENSTLNLSRMSGKVPELFQPGTSAWLLIQNPAVIEEYMRVVAFTRASDERGQVDVAVWIDDRGSVEWSEIARSSGNEEMDEVALALFNEVASFRPGRDQGVRISMSVIFSLSFPW